MVAAWEDTLCRRALTEGVSLSTNIAEQWPDAHLARDFGIHTYFGVPIASGKDHIRGTLCAIDRNSVPISAENQKIFRLFATLITREWEREILAGASAAPEPRVQRIRPCRSRSLTEIANRRGMLAELSRLLANDGRRGLPVHLAFIDLDGFKNINDRYGHEAGDRFLQGVALRLKDGIRHGDFVARYGGDEFVVFGLSSGGDPQTERQTWQTRLHQQTAGEYDLGSTVVD